MSNIVAKYEPFEHPKAKPSIDGMTTKTVKMEEKPMVTETKPTEEQELRERLEQGNFSDYTTVHMTENQKKLLNKWVRKGIVIKAKNPVYSGAGNRHEYYLNHAKYKEGMEIQINKFGAETYKVPEGTKGKITGIFQSPNGFVSYKLDLEGEGVLTSNGERRKDTYLGEDKIIPVVTPEPKEPHEMTRAEFNENPDNPFLANKDEEFRNNVHKTRVMAAIKEGKAIPPEVLKDYPGLQPQITKVHDDGDLTVKDKGANFVVTTEGKTFKEVAPPPEMKATIHTSHELGEQATQGRAEAARDAHNVEAAGSNPAPAIKSPEQPMREGHPISQAENRAIHAWYGEHGESKPKVEEEEKHEPIQTPGGEWRHDGKNWRFHKTATHNAKPAKMPSSVMHPGKVHNTPSPKGSPKPHMSMVRKGKMVVIKGVGTANVKHLPKGRILRKRK